MLTCLLAKNLYQDKQVTENQCIAVEGGRIISVQPLTNQPISQTFEHLTAGLFDAHINGGYDLYFTQNPTVETVLDIATASQETGTAYALPTLITSSTENILRGIAAVREYQRLYPDGGIPGMHLEGPFISVKKRGAHLAKYIRQPTNAELELLISASDGIIKLMTIAPEQLTEAQIRRLLAAGIAVSVGHTDATYEQATAAFAAGVRSVTHLFNAMSGFHHRTPGVVGAALDSPEVWMPVILDGHHCHYGAARVAYKTKPDKLFLISDALFLGEKKQVFQWEEFDATLKDGTYVNSEGNLAGGAVSLGDTVRNAVQEVGIPIAEALDMATSRPAQATNLADQIGRIAPGYPAVFTDFDSDLRRFAVVKV